MTVIGITGGIGSGKSVVTSLLASWGIPAYIADEESKRLVASSPELRRQLTDVLGRAVYNTDGRLNHSLMASLIFGDPRLLERVNGIIHPAVAGHFRSWAQNQTSKCVVLESAILFESGFDRQVDVRLTVYAPQALRLKRTMERDHARKADVLCRMKSQWPDKIKKERSDFVILNDEKHALIPQVERFAEMLNF
ncbi:MAG: dephospho-CoA kinase [Tannerella sp.]|jgi:dephospho-CoA kinase|nr:dephospho-CoA kinase [Tannerella sp.]